jgi:hypothetical protein
MPNPLLRVLPEFVPPPPPPVDLTRRRLHEIRAQLDRPRFGCLLCVGKHEEIWYLVRLLEHVRAEGAAFAEAPTTVMPSLDAAGDHLTGFAEGWRRACLHLSEQLAAELTRGRLAGWDAYRIAQAVRETIEHARRRRADGTRGTLPPEPTPEPDIWINR